MFKFTRDTILRPRLLLHTDTLLFRNFKRNYLLSPNIEPRSSIIPRLAIKSRKPSLTKIDPTDPFSTNAPLQGVALRVVEKNTVENRIANYLANHRVSSTFTSRRWYKIEGYIATAYRRSDRSYIPVAGRSIGAPLSRVLNDPICPHNK